MNVRCQMSDVRWCWSVALLAVFALLLSSTYVRADEIEPIQVGQPARIEVFPPAIKLNGPRRQAQVVVTGVYADGTVQDLTRAAAFPPSEQKAFKLDGTVVKPLADGAAELTVTVGGQIAKVPVEISGMAVSAAGVVRVRRPGRPHQAIVQQRCVPRLPQRQSRLPPLAAGVRHQGRSAHSDSRGPGPPHQSAGPRNQPDSVQAAHAGATRRRAKAKEG